MIAYCGPGRTIITALLLMLDGETVDRIEETPHLPDPDMILLVAPATFDLPSWPESRDGFR
jgi:hypothetical protein